MKIEELRESHIQEAFDTEVGKYQAVNLSPKDPIPQLFLIKVPGQDNLVLRIVSGKSVGTSVKKLTMSDNIMHVYIMSLSASGGEVKLKGGFGDDPLGAISTIFDTVFDTAKKIKAELIMFRLIKSQLKGKEKVVQRILDRLINARSGGKYVALEEIEELGTKFSYVVAKSKRVAIDNIKNLPPIDDKKFSTTETKVGKVYVNNKTGNTVDKATVIADALANSAESASPQSIASNTKISNRSILDAKSKPVGVDNTESSYKFTENPPIVIPKDNEQKFGTIKINQRYSDFTNTDGMSAKIKALKRKKGVTVKDVEAVAEELTRAEDFIKFPDLGTTMSRMLQNIITTSNPEEAILGLEKLHDIINIKDNYISGKISAKDAIRKSTEGLERFVDRNATSYGPTFASKVLSMYANIGRGVTEELNTYNPKQYSTVQAKGIQDFLSSKDDKINTSIKNGLYDKLSDKDKTTVENLDSSFASGENLSDKTTLWKRMKITPEQYYQIIKTGVIYFPEYLTASISTMDIDPHLDHSIHQNKMVPIKEVPERMYRQGTEVVMNLVISGASKVKTIVPGSLGKDTLPGGVILPRGITLKVKAMATEMERLDNLVEVEIVNPKLVESEDQEFTIKENELLSFSQFRKYHSL